VARGYLGLLVSTALILFPLFGLFLVVPLYRRIRRLPLQEQILLLLVLVIIYNAVMGSLYSSFSAVLLTYLYFKLREQEERETE